MIKSHVTITTGSCQLSPVVPESGYCIGEEVIYTCTQRVGTIDGVTYDALSLEVAESVTASEQLGSVGFIKDIHMVGSSASLTLGQSVRVCHLKLL